MSDQVTVCETAGEANANLAGKTTGWLRNGTAAPLVVAIEHKCLIAGEDSLRTEAWLIPTGHKFRVRWKSDGGNVEDGDRVTVRPATDEELDMARARGILGGGS